MDIITLAMAKSYTDSQRIAYDEKTAITWDGNTDGLTSIAPLGFPMYRVSDKLIPPGAVQATMADGRVLPDMASEPLPGVVLAAEGMLISAKAGEYAEGDMVISIPESGTYFAKPNSDNFVISVSFETIHPIDPKYIPPVDSLTMNGADGKQYKLTVNNGAISVSEVV